MSDLYKFDAIEENDNTNEVGTIKEINKYSVLVKHIDLLNESEIELIKREGYVDTMDSIVIKMALQYFITIISQDPQYLAFSYKTAIDNYRNSPYLDGSRAREFESIINEGVIRTLYNTPTFKRKVEIEREADTVEIANSMIYELSESGGDKDMLAMLKTISSIAKQNEATLRDNRDFVLLHLPDEAFVDSYTMLLHILDEVIDEYKQVNSVKAIDIKRRIREDEFIKREDVLTIERLSNL